MAKQSTLEGTDGDGVKLQTSFGGMQIVATKEPKLRDQVYLLVGGHVSQVKEAGSDETEKLIVTITGQGQLITKDQYYGLLGRGVPQDAPTPEELEALEAELAAKEADDGEA